MKKIIELLKQFEKRNNISAYVEVHGDESFSIREFWDKTEIFFALNLTELKEGLKNKNYKKDETDGRCLFPFEEIKN